MTTEEFRIKINTSIAGGKPLCFAHRGASGLAKENSLLAIIMASRIKECSGIEFDIHETQDEYLIVRHNFGLKTDKGNKWIKKLLLKEVRKYLSEEESPLLLNVINKLLNYEGVIDIEIKQKGIARKIINLCKEKGVYNKVVFTTVDSDIYREIRDIDDNVAVIFGYPKEKGKDLSQLQLVRPFVKLVVKLMRKRLLNVTKNILSEVDTPFISYYNRIITARVVNYLHENNRFCLGATINVRNDTKEKESIASMTHMLENGVDLIKTDYPNLYRQVI